MRRDLQDGHEADHGEGEKDDEREDLERRHERSVLMGWLLVGLIVGWVGRAIWNAERLMRALLRGRA